MHLDANNENSFEIAPTKQKSHKDLGTLEYEI